MCMAILTGLGLIFLSSFLVCDAFEKISLSKELDINSDVRMNYAVIQSTLWYISEKKAANGSVEFRLVSITGSSVHSPTKPCKIPIQLTKDTLQITIFPLNTRKAIVNWTKFNETTYLTRKLFVDFDDCEVIAQDFTWDRISNVCPEVDYRFILPRWSKNGTVYIDTEFDEDKCAIVFRVDHQSLPKFSEDEIALENAEFVWTLPMALDNGNTNECLYFQSAERLKASLFYTKKVLQIFHPKGKEFRWTGISTSHGVLGLCKVDAPNSRSLNCSQSLKVWTRLNFDYDPENSIMHNLLGGEYLILSMKRLPSQEDHLVSNYVIHLTKFGADGQQLLNVEVTKCQCHGVNIVTGDVYEDEAGDYCVSLLPRLEKIFTVKCFYKNSLKQK